MVMKWLNSVFVLAAACATAGCASQRGLTVTGTVGPGGRTGLRLGGLEVYTATERHRDGDNTYYYPHSAYVICDTHGVRVKSVVNHIGVMDETPTFVSLPQGHYIVVAQADRYGQVRIPVVVRPGGATVVHLDRGWQPPPDAEATDIVRMPDGEPIGWSSASRLRGPVSGPTTTTRRFIAG
jgi:hypothetical protein